jgi:O-antigen/teichoic acid export membrane protein
MTLGQGASAYLVSADRQTALMVLTLVFSALRLGVAWASIAHFGLLGAVAASVTLAILGSGSTVWLALHETRTSLPWSRMLRMALAAALAALCVLPLGMLQPPLLVLLLGGLAYALLYPVALWLLRCLTPEDADYVRRIASRIGERFARGRDRA